MYMGHGMRPTLMSYVLSLFVFRSLEMLLPEVEEGFTKKQSQYEGKRGKANSRRKQV